MNMQTKISTKQILTKRAAHDRGIADFGWLKSAHSFSFGSYYDPMHMQFGTLRVINDDIVAAGSGFPSHPHRNAEIFSYVLEGVLSHEDSIGNGNAVSAGGVQYMSAGRGITHSEFNPSDTDRTRFLQVWLTPDKQDVEPRYGTLDISAEDKRGKLKLFLSPDGREGSIKICASARVYAAMLDGDESILHDLGMTPKSWLQLASGALNLNGERLEKGDGVAIEGGGVITIDAGENAEILLIEMDCG